MGTRLSREEYYRLRTEYLRLKSALHDANTCLTSYHARFHHLRQFFERVPRVGVVVVEVGDLHRAEAVYGWQVYDDLLRKAGSVLAALPGDLLPADAVVALDGIGAERFVIFTPTDAAGGGLTLMALERMAGQVAQRLATAFAGEEFRSMSPRPAFRLGHSLFGDDPFHRFERLVYRAVERARNRETARQDRVRSRHAAALERILEEGRIEFAFQPIFSLDGAGVVGHEALARVPDDGAFPDPRALFDLSVDLGLAAELDALCLRRALQAAGSAAGGRKLFLNTLPATLLDPAVAVVPPLEWIDRSGWTRGDVVIEISERGPAEDRNRLLRQITHLREGGVGVALDDIGTGLTGLQGIADLRPDFVKLDVSLVRNIDSNLISQDLLRSLARVARSVGARVVGEGVETRQEAEALVACGADFAQGFLFSGPQPSTATPP